jgi:hypothetical protein
VTGRYEVTGTVFQVVRYAGSLYELPRERHDGQRNPDEDCGCTIVGGQHDASGDWNWTFGSQHSDSIA